MIDDDLIGRGATSPLRTATEHFVSTNVTRVVETALSQDGGLADPRYPSDPCAPVTPVTPVTGPGLADETTRREVRTAPRRPSSDR